MAKNFLTTSSNCRPSTDTNSCISSDPLEYPLAFLQSQTITTYTCHTYMADIYRYTTFCISKQKQSFQGFHVFHQTQHRNSLSTLSSHHHGTPLPNQGQVRSSPWHPPSGKTNVVVCLYTGVLWFSPLQGDYFLIHKPVQSAGAPWLIRHFQHTSNSCITLQLKSSKTDTYCQGHSQVLVSLSMHQYNTTLSVCLQVSLSMYMRRQQKWALLPGLFRHWDGSVATASHYIRTPLSILQSVPTVAWVWNLQ